MGGNVWVESEPGQGSTFHFKVRFGLQKLRTGAQRSPDGPAPLQVPTEDRRRLKILLAEDNLVNLKDGLIGGFGLHRNPHRDFALRSELQGVSHQIGDDLSQPGRVTQQSIRQFEWNVASEL